MAVELICEIATSHGGNVSLAEEMIAAAADSGAHTVKFQHFTLSRLNKADPQREWLEQSHLDEKATERLMKACQREGVQFLSTPMDREAWQMLRDLGCTRFKAASTGELLGVGQQWIKSWSWGKVAPWRELDKKGGLYDGIVADLTAIPLYPTPLEAVSAVPLLDGWSDHTCGIAACQHMLSKGARIIEAHFCLPGKSRQMSWDKTPQEFREIRDWSDTVQTMVSGVATHFRERWKTA
jgi:sialic acid synthase SpsE